MILTKFAKNYIKQHIDDYDLGWFKKAEYNRLYSKEDWYN